MSSTVFYASSAELATLTNTFKVAGVATDPSTVSLTVTDPTGTATTYGAGQVVRVTAGVFSMDVPCTTAGTWQAVWQGTGAASDVETVTWIVHDTSLSRLYATPAALKARLGMSASDTADDDQLVEACFTASRAIEQDCSRTFWRSASAARTFAPDDLYCLALPDFCDLVSVSAVACDADGDGVFETAWTASDWQLLPVNPSVGPETRPYTAIRAVTSRTFPLPLGTGRTDLVQVTGVWGWPAVPYAIRTATLILAAEVFKLKDAPGGGVAGITDFGVVTVRDNPMVSRLVGPYRRSIPGIA